jgi:hypothetical protein
MENKVTVSAVIFRNGSLELICTLIRTSLQICLDSSQHFCSGTVQHFFFGSSQHLSFGSSQHLVCGPCNVKQLFVYVHGPCASIRYSCRVPTLHNTSGITMRSLAGPWAIGQSQRVKIDDPFSVSVHSFTSDKQDDLPASSSDLNPNLKFSPNRILPCF